ncbi:MAG: hypothetical protein IT292_09260 [Deltaproteobacteria bacterium]|nr:hypothetical protein [Deltaproteobacteria bacterium]
MVLANSYTQDSNKRRGYKREVQPELKNIAIRTAFVARFIVLREGRRSRAHRLLEKMTWDAASTAQDLARKFRSAFEQNGDNLKPVDRDIERSLKHAERSAGYFIEEYISRATESFVDAIKDYHRSNQLLFGEEPEAVPRKGGWRLNEVLGKEEDSDEQNRDTK